MDQIKFILVGNFSFGKEKTYHTVFEQFQHRMETYYKNDIIVGEDDFKEDKLTFEVPKKISYGTGKTWKNTISFLEFLSQYAVSGKMQGWKVVERKVVDHFSIEPNNDKITVQSYVKGVQFIDEKGKEEYCISALDKAIKKFDKHAEAYERRGFINYKMGKYADAMRDFTKSITISPFIPQAFLGRAKLYWKEERFEDCIQDLAAALRTSIPHEEIFWQCRKMKGECHLKLEDYKSASEEFKYYTNKKFEESNINYRSLPEVYILYGQSLLALEEYELAVKIFNKSKEFEDDKVDELNPAESTYYLAVAKQQGGFRGYKKEFQKAASLGSKKAKKLLAK